MTDVTGVSSLGGDQFSLDGNVVDLDTVIMLIELQRADNLEIQLAGRLDAMAALNAMLKEANELLSTARAMQNELGNNNKTSQMPPEMIEFFENNGIQQGTSEWDSKHKGEDWGLHLDTEGYDFMHDKDEWDVSIKNLQSFIDGLNSRSQLDMINISSLMKKRDESLTTPAQTNKTLHDSRMSVIRTL